MYRLNMHCQATPSRPRFQRFSCFQRLQRFLGPVLTVAVLSGCAYAPGLQLNPEASSDAGRSSSKVTLLSLLNSPKQAALAAPTTPAAPASAEAPVATAERIPPVTLLPITPDLIRQQKSATPVQTKEALQHLIGLPQPYTIGPGDVLNIVVWDHPQLNLPTAGGLVLSPDSGSYLGNGYNISPNGTIQFPYVGSIKLAGLTEDQARNMLAQQLGRFLKDPQITLRIQAYRSGRVYLDGEVSRPGLQALNDLPLTLPEAIARAGGLSASADRSRILVTRGNRTTVINLQQLVAEGINPNQILLASGDLVRVASLDEAKVYVMGEVLRPTTLPLKHGKLNLNQALGESGGISPVSGDPKQVYVVRSDGGENPQVFHLNASNAVAYALAEGFDLRARDVVYVDPAPLVRWNRVISLLLPSAQAVSVSKDAINK